MTHIGNWVAQLRKMLSSGRLESGFRDSAAQPSEEWEPVKHQDQSLHLLSRAVDHPDSSVFFFDFSGIRATLQRGSSQDVRARYEAIQQIFATGVGATDIAHRYDDLSHFLFFAGAGRSRGAEICHGLWNQLVRRLALDPAASKGLRLFEVDVPIQDNLPAPTRFDAPSLRFHRIIPDVPRSGHRGDAGGNRHDRLHLPPAHGGRDQPDFPVRLYSDPTDRPGSFLLWIRRPRRRTQRPGNSSTRPPGPRIGRVYSPANGKKGTAKPGRGADSLRNAQASNEPDFLCLHLPAADSGL